MPQPLHQLARIRINLGLSQFEVGTRAGFSQQYVSMLERGLKPSEFSHVLRLAAVLGVRPEDLSAEQLTISVTVNGK